MHSLGRQHHIRLENLRNFLCTYNPSSGITPQEWSRTASANLKHGDLIFMLERIVPPFGLTSFVRKDDDENFRVSEFAMVVRMEDSRPMVLSITAGTYELRFFEALLEEKARKTIVEHRKFSFVTAKPAKPFAKSTIEEIERLANLYAQGGSRRDFMAEDARVDDEPAMALLSACGVRLNIPSANKQPLDLGVICYLLFSPDGVQPDNNRTELKSNYLPFSMPAGSQAEVDQDVRKVSSPPSDFSNQTGLPGGQLPVPLFNQDSLKAALGTGGQIAGDTKEGDFSVLQSWGEAYGQKNLIGNSSLLKQLTSGLDKKQPQNPLEVDLNSVGQSTEIPTNVPNNEGQKSPAEPPKFAADDDVYHHISQAITGLLDEGQIGTTQPAEAALPTVQKVEPDKWVAAQIQAQRQNIEQNIEQNKEQTKEQTKEQSKELSPRKIPSVRSFEKLPAIPASLTRADTSPFSESKPLTPVAQELTILETVQREQGLAQQDKGDTTLKDTEELQNLLPKQTSSMANADTDNQFSISESPVTMATESGAVPAKLDDFQEPKVVMNEMASLMNKLESQVGRAAKKLTVQANEIEKRLTADLDAMSEAVTQEGKDAEAKLVIYGDSLSKQFESLFDNLRATLAEKAASGRQSIKSTLAEHQGRIDIRQNELRHSLDKEFNQNQDQSGKIVQDQEEHFSQLVNAERQTLLDRLDMINKDLEKMATQLAESLSAKFTHFEARVDEEILAIIDAIDHNMSILSKDIELARANGLDKLKKEKSDFIASLEHLVISTEIALSRQIRASQTEFFLPRLKERKQAIESMIQQMMHTFAEQALTQAKAQLEGLESSLSAAREQLKELIEECLAKLDLVGRDQQAGLEEIFKSAAYSLEQNTESVQQLLKQAAQEVMDGEEVCKKLAENYSLDSDPALTNLRQNVYAKVDTLKAQLRSDLEAVLESNCAKLEELSLNHHARVSAKRTELAQHVRFSSEQGLQRIRAAIHDAYNAIQAEREKYME